MARFHVASLLVLLSAVACSTPSEARGSSSTAEGERDILAEQPGSSLDVPKDNQSAAPSNGTVGEFVSYPVNTSATHGGVTVRIRQVRYSPLATMIDLVVLADRDYGFVWDEELPPQYAYLLNDFQLVDDRGRLVANRSGEYRFARSESAREVAFDHSYVFDAPSPDATELTLQMSSVVLGNVRALDTIEFELEGFVIGDEWLLDSKVVFGPLSLVLERARLGEAAAELHSFRLETDYSFEATQFEGTTIRPTCVRMYSARNSSFSSLQDSGCVEHESTTFVEFGSAKILNPSMPIQPIQFMAITDVIVDGPWNITWRIER